MICPAPFNIEDLSKQSQRSIKKALKKCFVNKISAIEHVEELYQVYVEAYTRYRITSPKMSYKEFYNKCVFDEENGVEYWGGYDIQTNRMIGYMSCNIYKDYVNLSTSKYSADVLNLRVSDAINYIVLNNYLSNKDIKYVLNGEISINHKTNVQQYYIEHFNFKKAYCKLHVKYRWWVKSIIYVLYPFRVLLSKSENKYVHDIYSVLKMEQIRRKCSKR